MPFAFDQAASVQWETFGDADGSVWNTTVGPLWDMSEILLAENSFNSPAPDGVVFAGFDVTMSLVDAGKVPLSQSFNFNWEVVGGETNAVYDVTTIETDSFGCGVAPNEFDSFDEVFLGGTVSGTVCIPIPVEDFDDPATAVSMAFEERVFFAQNGVSPTPTAQAKVDDAFDIGERDGSRQNPFSYDSPTAVRFETFGDADGSIWTVSFTKPADGTGLVLAENSFNEPPPDDAAFAVFDMEMTLDEASVEPLSPGFNVSIEIVGGATGAVYQESTLAGLGCGVIPDEFDDFAEVFAGGTLSGGRCVPIPAVDLEHPNTRVAIKFAEDTRVYFG